MNDQPDDDLGIRLRYVGKRFDGARLPLDVLADLPAFRDLLVAFARGEWFNVNPDRQRVPKGFEKSLSFDLTAIEDGSAIPQLKWDRFAAQANLPDFTDELEAIVGVSFDDVMSLVDQAGNGAFPKALTSEHVRALNKFGSGLRDGERIEFMGTKGADGNVIYLDSVRRKSLITKVREFYEARWEGSGTLIGLLANEDGSGNITVQTDEYGPIVIPLDRETVVVEFDGNVGSPVQFDLQVEFDNADKYRSVIAMHSVDLIDERIAGDVARCKKRLDDVSMLLAGWDDGEGLAIAPESVKAASTFLDKRPLLCGSYCRESFGWRPRRAHAGLRGDSAPRPVAKRSRCAKPPHRRWRDYGD